MKARYNFHLDDGQLAALKRRAYDERTTVSELIRVAIAAFLKHGRPDRPDAFAGDSAAD